MNGAQLQTPMFDAEKIFQGVIRRQTTQIFDGFRQKFERIKVPHGDGRRRKALPRHCG